MFTFHLCRFLTCFVFFHKFPFILTSLKFYENYKLCLTNLSSTLSSPLVHTFSSFKVVICLSGGCVPVESVSDWSLYITWSYVPLENLSHWRLCPTAECMLLENVTHWKLDLIGGCVLLEDVSYCMCLTGGYVYSKHQCSPISLYCMFIFHLIFKNILSFFPIQFTL